MRKKIENDDMIQNAIRWTKCLWYLPKIVWFNFHYLPFKQAIKLPVLMHKPKFLCCRGTLTINGRIQFGMIRLGFYVVPNYPNSGIIWNVRGNVIFDGHCIIGGDSLIDVGRKGNLQLGDNVVSSAGLKINCYHKIIIGKKSHIGYGNYFVDTSLHVYKIVRGNRTIKSKGYDPIIIGSYNWFGFGTTTFAGASTPDYCIVGAKSFLNRSFAELGERCFLAGDPAVLKTTGVYRDFDDDDIIYE
jgi:acetyltransferase-like isoleucine patch superfamily enzyme